MRLKFTILFFICILISLTANSPAAGSARQDPRPGSGTGDPQDSVSAALYHVLKDVEEGIINGDANLFASSIAPQIYINLSNSDEGYFSSNQSSFVIQHFLSASRLATFHFSTIRSDDSSAYATGGGTVVRRGFAEIIQVYVSLKYQNGAWLLTQFNVY